LFEFDFIVEYVLAIVNGLRISESIGYIFPNIFYYNL